MNTWSKRYKVQKAEGQLWLYEEHLFGLTHERAMLIPLLKQNDSTACWLAGFLQRAVA